MCGCVSEVVESDSPEAMLFLEFKEQFAEPRGGDGVVGSGGKDPSVDVVEPFFLEEFSVAHDGILYECPQSEGPVA